MSILLVTGVPMTVFVNFFHTVKFFVRRKQGKSKFWSDASTFFLVFFSFILFIYLCIFFLLCITRKLLSICCKHVLKIIFLFNIFTLIFFEQSEKTIETVKNVFLFTTLSLCLKSFCRSYDGHAKEQELSH